MSIRFRALVLSVTCLSVIAAPAFAAAPGHGMTTLSRLPKPHALNAAPALANLTPSPAQAQLALTQPFLDRPSASGAMAAASDLPSGDPAASMAQTTAADAAHDVAATTGTCDAYFTQSQALTANLNQIFPAMADKNMTAMSTLLPALEKQLAALPATEIAAEICGGNHINAYTSYQYFELSTLRAHGITGLFPANLPIVKQPELNQGALAYAVGWIKYEKADYQGALAAYSKGLVLYPHDHSLQAEYLATLMQLNRGADMVSFAENALYGTYDLDDATRAKLYVARAVGQIMTGQLDAADSSFTVSLLYNYNDDTKSMQDTLRTAMTKK